MRGGAAHFRPEGEGGGGARSSFGRPWRRRTAKAAAEPATEKWSSAEGSGNGGRAERGDFVGALGRFGGAERRCGKVEQGTGASGQADAAG